MASWLQNQLKAAEELLHAVDRTAKSVSTAQGGRPGDERPRPQGSSGSVPSFRQERQAGAQAPSLPLGTSVEGLGPSSGGSRSAELATEDSQPRPAAASAGFPPSANPVASQDEAAGREAAVPATAFQQKSTGIPFGRPAPQPAQASSLPALATAAANPPTGSEKQQAAAAPEPAAQSLLAAAPQPASAAALAPAAAPAAQQAQQPEALNAPSSGAVHEPTQGVVWANHAAPTVNPGPSATPAIAAGTAAPSEAGEWQEPAATSASGPQSQTGESADAPAPSGPPQPATAVAAAEEPAGQQPTAPSGTNGDANDDTGLLRIGQELDEARGMAGAPASQRELRLQKMLERLKQRLEQYKQENQQLEELLAVADAKAKGGTGEIERLEDEVARAQASRISAEAALQQALAAKDGEVRSLKEQLEAANRKVSAAEEKLQQLKEANDTLIAERKVSEGQLIQSLRKEVEGIEQVLEEERAAHAATRKAAAAREHELEGTLQGSASSLSRMQREVEDRTARLSALEERCAALEHEVDGLTHQLRTTEGKLQKQVELAQQCSSEALQARIAELEGALQSERGATAAAEQGRAAADEELVRLRAEVGSLRRQVADAASQDAGDLQRRLKEVTDLLYLKQTQLERIASEKAAQQLQLERELAQARAEAEQVKRRARTDRAIAAAEDSVVPMDAIGDAYHRLANNNRVGTAVKAGAKLLDATASQVVRILRQYPVGRLVVFGYILGVHLFIYMLIHRLQRRAFIAEHRAAVAAADLDDVHDQLGG